MRTQPKNISAHPDGWLVRVERLGVRYQAFVPYGPVGTRSTASQIKSLARAIALRDGFYRIAGECSRPNVIGPHKRGHSNTGEPGISESCHWSHQRPHPCFIVHVRRLRADGTTRGTNRRFYYGPRCPRDQAMAAARQFRQQKEIRQTREATPKRNDGGRTSASRSLACLAGNPN
jgi:hypothetical protein